MGFAFRNRTISTVGIIGSGRSGPDLALFFVKALQPFGVNVLIVDSTEEALDNAKAGLHKKVDKAAESGAYKPKDVEAAKGRITFSVNLDDLKEADLVVEALGEDPNQKIHALKQVENVIHASAILLSNTGLTQPEALFAELQSKGRALCVNYLSPADRNMLVEVVPGQDTNPNITEFVMRFHETLGKIPIREGSRFGFAAAPVLEGLLVAGIRCVESGLAEPAQVDAVAKKTLGTAFGPLAAATMRGANASESVLKEMSEKLGPWFKVPTNLADVTQKAGAEATELPPNKGSAVQEQLLAAYFALVGNVLDARIITPTDLDLLLTLGLGMKSPFTLMNSMGLDKSLALVSDYLKGYNDMPIPTTLSGQASSGALWEILDVTFHREDDVGVITIRRPKALNALNTKVFKELERYCHVIQTDPSIKAAVVAGFGAKAFVAGADIKEMSNLSEPAQGEAFARKGQLASGRLEELGKPVVGAINGLMFGGGCELAMCCTARVAPKGLKMFAGQPEVNLGLIPGMGGTQRLPRLVGFERAAHMIRTADPISGEAALEYGLVNELVEGDVLPRAIELAREIADGRSRVKQMETGPLPDAPDSLPDIDIGHHSKVIDRLAVLAILEGGKMTLENGLKNEAKRFGECWTTQDTPIGLKTFVEKGARTKAEFIHK